MRTCSIPFNQSVSTANTIASLLLRMALLAWAGEETFESIRGRPAGETAIKASGRVPVEIAREIADKATDYIQGDISDPGHVAVCEPIAVRQVHHRHKRAFQIAAGTSPDQAVALC